MKINELRDLLKNKLVIEEINRHLWIESQKAGYSIGIERATDEWLKLYAEGWMRYHMPERYKVMQEKHKKGKAKAQAKKKSAAPQKKRVTAKSAA